MPLLFGGLVVVPVIALGQQQARADTLNSSAVPPAFLPWVVKAGSMCPQVSAPIIAAQIDKESGWNPNAVNKESGAQGASQFMPETWAQVGRDDDGNGVASPFDIGDAVMAQGRYDCQVAQMVAHLPGDRTDLMLAAYNAGPGKVLAAGGIPQIPETVAYVRIIRDLARTKYATAAGAIPVECTTTPQDARATKVCAVLAVARSKLGTPYEWGGGGPNGPGATGWDCSSYMQYVFFQGAGISLPRTTWEQVHAGSSVSRADLSPGDIIIFGADEHHVGLYIGNGQMIHEPETGDVAKISTIVGNSYWEGERPWQVRRIL